MSPPHTTMSELFKLKTAFPISTGQSPAPAVGALFAFANSEPQFSPGILGQPPDGAACSTSTATAFAFARRALHS
eukprot:4810617-Pleurochrysis_carterae.AAC.2